MNYQKIDKYLGEKLFENRVVKRITQEQMADRINGKLKALGKKEIARQTYSAYERGTREIPSDVFRIACELLHLDYNDTIDEAFEHCKEDL